MTSYAPPQCRHFSHTYNSKCQNLALPPSRYCTTHSCPVCSLKKFAFQTKCSECGGEDPRPVVGCNLHSVCVKHRGGKLTGHVVPILLEYNQGGPPVGLFGMERFGRYRGQLNVVGGKGDPGEKCLVSEMQRETREEIKWKPEIDRLYHLGGSPLEEEPQFRHIVFHGTIVFIALLDDGMSRRPFNDAIQEAMHQIDLPHSEKEMSGVEWVDFQGNCVSSPGTPVSSFARGVLDMINLKYRQGTLL